MNCVGPNQGSPKMQSWGGWQGQVDSPQAGRPGCREGPCQAADRTWAPATWGSWGTQEPRTAWTGQCPSLNVFFLFCS